VVLLDLVMPGISRPGHAEGNARPRLQAAGDRDHGDGGIDTVVKAMQAGAVDFFVKPASPERILVSIRNALSIGALKGEVDRLKKQGGRPHHLRRPDRRRRP
jgi:DNA-binding NtrC family response regulator